MAGEKKTISGNTTGDPEVKTLNDGRQIVAFTVAENKRFLDPDTQEWKDAKATFYDVAIEREHLAKHVLASVEKGQRVKVEGKVTASRTPIGTVQPRSDIACGPPMWLRACSLSLPAAA